MASCTKSGFLCFKLSCFAESSGSTSPLPRDEVDLVRVGPRAHLHRRVKDLQPRQRRKPVRDACRQRSGSLIFRNPSCSSRRSRKFAPSHEPHTRNRSREVSQPRLEQLHTPGRQQVQKLHTRRHPDVAAAFKQRKKSYVLNFLDRTQKPPRRLRQAESEKRYTTTQKYIA